MLDTLEEIVIRPALQRESLGLYALACFVFKCGCSSWINPDTGEQAGDTWYCNKHATEKQWDNKPRYLEDNGVCWKCKTLPPDDRVLTFTKGEQEIEVKLCEYCKKTDQPALLAWLDTLLAKKPKIKQKSKSGGKKKASWQEQMGF